MQMAGVRWPQLPAIPFLQRAYQTKEVMAQGQL